MSRAHTLRQHGISASQCLHEMGAWLQKGWGRLQSRFSTLAPQRGHSTEMAWQE